MATFTDRIKKAAESSPATTIDTIKADAAPARPQFKDISLRHFIKPNGTVCQADAAGIFTPADYDEFEMLRYYNEQGFVEFIGPEVPA